MTTPLTFPQAAANMEQALADTLQAVRISTSNVDDIARILKLIIKKEIVLEFLLEEFPSA